MDHEERLAVFLDYENLALGAREHLGGMSFDFGPIADALAVRGRVVVRRAYADWSYFDEDRRALTRHHVELIEIPQRMGASRKNSADIKMVVDAVEMAFEREYISTFVMCTGDSDFSPLVHKLRELNKRVIGVGVEKSTSKLLPPACDEFLFYDRLEGVDVPDTDERRSTPVRASSGRRKPRSVKTEGTATPALDAPIDTASSVPLSPDERSDIPMEVRLAQTLSDLQSSQSGPVTASVLKRALLRKDPTFAEAEYGFRSFGEFLVYLAERGVIVLTPLGHPGDPVVALPAQGDLAQAFQLLQEVVASGPTPRVLSGLKNGLRKKQPAFSEKSLGFRGFLQFAKAARDAGVVQVTWDESTDDYVVTVPDLGPSPSR